VNVKRGYRGETLAPNIRLNGLKRSSTFCSSGIVGLQHIIFHSAPGADFNLSSLFRFILKCCSLETLRIKLNLLRLNQLRHVCPTWSALVDELKYSRLTCIYVFVGLKMHRFSSTVVKTNSRSTYLLIRSAKSVWCQSSYLKIKHLLDNKRGLT